MKRAVRTCGRWWSSRQFLEARRREHVGHSHETSRGDNVLLCQLLCFAPTPRVWNKNRLGQTKKDLSPVSGNPPVWLPTHLLLPTRHLDREVDSVAQLVAAGRRVCRCAVFAAKSRPFFGRKLVQTNHPKMPRSFLFTHRRYNASPIPTGKIAAGEVVHSDGPVNQWTKIRRNSHQFRVDFDAVARVSS